MIKPSTIGIICLAAAVGFVANSIWRAQQHSNPDDLMDIMFDTKAFFDGGAQVYIAGTLTGDGVPYKNNTTAVTCYLERKECEVSSVEQIGDKHIGRLASPDSYPIKRWDQHEIVAVTDWPIFSSGLVPCSSNHN